MVCWASGPARASATCQRPPARSQLWSLLTMVGWTIRGGLEQRSTACVAVSIDRTAGRFAARHPTETSDRVPNTYSTSRLSRRAGERSAKRPGCQSRRGALSTPPRGCAHPHQNLQHDRRDTGLTMAEARRSEGKPLIRRRVLLNKRGGMGTVTKKMQKEGGLRFGPIFVPVEPKVRGLGAQPSSVLSPRPHRRCSPCSSWPRASTTAYTTTSRCT